MSNVIECVFRHESIGDYDKLVALETILASALPNGHHIDGHDFGSGTMSLFVLGNDQHIVEKCIQQSTDLPILSIRQCEKSIPQGQWKPGDVLRADLMNGLPIYGRNLGFDKAIGQVVVVYDSAGMSASTICHLISRPLIVRAVGLHPDVVAVGEWAVVGTSPLTSQDMVMMKDAPGVISSENLPLLSANAHYGLIDDQSVSEYINPDCHPIPAMLYFGAHPFPVDIEELLMLKKNDEYFLDDIWMEALEWEKGNQLEEARRILTNGHA